MTTKAKLANLLVECMDRLDGTNFSDIQELYDRCALALDPEANLKLLHTDEGFFTPTFDDEDFPEDNFSFISYQEIANKTIAYDNEIITNLERINTIVNSDYIKKAIFFLRFNYCVNGLVSEAGEVADKAKKVFRNQDGHFATPPEKSSNEKLVTEFDFVLELGDVLWYINAIAHLLGVNLEVIAKKNNEKLLDREARNMIKDSGDNR